METPGARIGPAGQGRMTITKILTGSHGPTERGCSWLWVRGGLPASSDRMGRQVDHCRGVCVRARGTLLLPLPMR